YPAELRALAGGDRTRGRHRPQGSATGTSEALRTRQLRCLPDPTREQLLVERLALVDVEVARALGLRGDGRQRSQRGAVEEGDLDVARQAVEAEEPALALDAVEGRVPAHRLADLGQVAGDELVEAA